MRGFKCVVMGVLLSLWVVAATWAAVPTSINYQGVLTDSAGAPITNAAQSMTFALYDAATAGTALWSDTQTVDVQNGSYTVELGSAQNPLSASLVSSGSVWLEIAVGTGAPMSPRQKLNSVPYAFEAVNAQNAATATTVNGTASGDGSGLTNLDWGNLTNVPAGFADSTDNVVTSVDGLAGGTITGKVTVNTTGELYAGIFKAWGANYATGILGSSNGPSSDTQHTGVFGAGWFGQHAYGVYGSAKIGKVDTTGVFGYANEGDGKNSGVRGLSDGSNGIHGTNYGLYGEASRGPDGNYGVYATTTGTGANDFAGYLEGDAAVTGAMTVGTGVKDTSTLHVAGGNWDVGTTEGDFKIGDATNRLKIGVATGGGGAGIARIYADGATPKIILGTGTTDVLTVSGGNVGIGTLDPTYKLYVAGDAYTTGIWNSSDRRLKTHIRTLENALDKVSLLRGVRFDWRADEFPERGLGHDPQIGVIAQEVEQVLPALVHTDDQGYKAVAYDKISAVLIEAVKELKTENEALRALVCQDHPEARLCQ